MSPLIDVATGLGNRIGRHFSVSALLPGLFLTLWAYLLVASGAPLRHPDLSGLGHAFTSLTEFAWLLVIAVAVALLLHPLQFPATQLLEGYWGSSRMGVAAAATRATHHRSRQRILDRRTAIASAALMAASPDEDGWQDLLGAENGDWMVRYYIQSQEAERQSSVYPDAFRIMPTTLGNVLRRHEDSAGQRFGLDIIQVAPYLAAIAPSDQVAYLSDAREEMDTAISLSVAGLLAALITVGMLMLDRGWLLLALVPYAIAYISYRGAVAAAEEYGLALSVLASLCRFELYERLHLPAPDALVNEQRRNKDLAYLLGAEEAGPAGDQIRYQHLNMHSARARGRRRGASSSTVNRQGG
jgi:hypothetical protein